MNWKKKGALLVSATAMLLAACGNGGSGTESNTSNNNSSTSTDSQDINLKIWVDPGSGEFYTDLINDYKEQNDISYTIEVVESDTGKAQEFIKKDPSAAADVFSMPHDQLGQLVEAGVIYENTKYADRIKEENTELAVDGATYQDKVYGYPYGVESLMLYYDKSKLSEDDVKEFETLVEKGTFGGNFEEAGADYFINPLFVSNGALLYGEDGEDSKGTTFNNDRGLSVLKWINSLRDNSNVINANADLLSLLESGRISAMVSGPWGYSNIQEILGENFGVAKYPTVDFGDGRVQMRPFLGVKLYSVNASTQHPLEAMALADYLSSFEAQEKTYKELGTIPSNLELQGSDIFNDNPMAKVVIETSAPENSVLMPQIPEMVTFWPASLAIISDTYKGNIPESEMQAKLDQLVEDTSGQD